MKTTDFFLFTALIVTIAIAAAICGGASDPSDVEMRQRTSAPIAR
jgi:hypothetical protein